MGKINQPSAHADTKAYNLRPSNSSKRPIESVDEVWIEKDASFYDMNGNKILIILNQHRFKTTNIFKRPPSTRNGTFNDVRRLKEVFYGLGFKIFVMTDFKYQNIIDHITAIVDLDHTRTSCICVTILTHGDKGGQILAADKPYQLSQLIAIFEKKTSLINKPKLFFVQACRGGSMDAGHPVKYTVGSQSDGVLTMLTEMPSCYFCSNYHFLGCCGLLDLFKDAGSTDRLNSQRASVLTVPTHADIFVLRSTVEDYLSYRDQDGTWMIQALCDAIQDHNEDLNLLEMIVLVNRTVAYDRITSCCKWKAMNNKKQMPEARFTLTKQLKF